MKTGIIALVLCGTLAACGSSSRVENLPVRNGPQTQDPYGRGDTPGPVGNCTVNCNGAFSLNG